MIQFVINISITEVHVSEPVLQTGGNSSWSMYFIETIDHYKSKNINTLPHQMMLLLFLCKGKTQGAWENNLLHLKQIFAKKKP